MLTGFSLRAVANVYSRILVHFSPICPKAEGQKAALSPRAVLLPTLNQTFINNTKERSCQRRFKSLQCSDTERATCKAPDSVWLSATVRPDAWAPRAAGHFYEEREGLCNGVMWGSQQEFRITASLGSVHWDLNQTSPWEYPLLIWMKSTAKLVGRIDR